MPPASTTQAAAMNAIFFVENALGFFDRDFRAASRSMA
jgi:hypothetical protein